MTWPKFGAVFRDLPARSFSASPVFRIDPLPAKPRRIDLCLRQQVHEGAEPCLDLRSPSRRIVGDRNVYMSALERASVGEDIVPFTDFLADLVRKGLAGEPLPAVPKSS